MIILWVVKISLLKNAMSLAVSLDGLINKLM